MRGVLVLCSWIGMLRQSESEVVKGRREGKRLGV